MIGRAVYGEEFLTSIADNPRHVFEQLLAPPWGDKALAAVDGEDNVDAEL
jgi:hypothetical protein